MNKPSNQIKFNRNFWAFTWHSFWLALAQTFADRNTVLPGLILLVGGTKMELGILTSILIGVPIFAQLLFAAFLSRKRLKKFFLLIGIYLRVFAFGGVVWTLSLANEVTSWTIILLVYFWMILFTVSGAFAGVSYTDVLGKSIKGDTRKKFFVVRQFFSSLGILISALAVRQILHSFNYPKNYELAFSLAAVLLFVAALGFIAIKETPTKIVDEHFTFIQLVKSIPKVFRRDKNLKYFIIISNLVGFSFTVMPFYIALAKERYHLNEQLIGNFLLFQILGMILSNFVWNFIVKKYSFKGMLKATIIIEGLLPLIAIIFSNYFPIEFYSILFFFTGSAISAHKISFGGMLLEISTETNRALYTGIYGALSLTVAFFPLLIGPLINVLNYNALFIVLGLLIFTSLVFVRRINCNTV